MTEYRRWLAAERGLAFDDYARLWRWSVDDLEAFWASIWDFFEVRPPTSPPPRPRLAARCRAPSGSPALGLNYAEHVFRDRERLGDSPSSTPPSCASSASSAGASCAHRSRASPPACARSGSSPATASSPTSRTPRGDRRLPRHRFDRRDLVAAARPTSAPASVVDRFAQIEPKVLLAVDGYRYGGKDFDRTRRPRRACRRGCRASSTPWSSPTSTPTPTSPRLRDAIAWDELEAAGAGAELGLRAGPVRPPALGPLLLRHHRAAEGDRPGPRRDPARAPEEAPPARRPASPATASSGSRPPAG